MTGRSSIKRTSQRVRSGNGVPIRPDTLFLDSGGPKNEKLVRANELCEQLGGRGRFFIIAVSTCGGVVRWSEIFPFAGSWWRQTISVS